MSGKGAEATSGVLVLERNIIRSTGNKVIIEGPFGETVECDIKRFEDGIGSIAMICGRPVYKDKD